MTIDINKNSALIDSAASGYSGCGCGNRRYYTKAEIDEMFKNILDPEQIEELVNSIIEEYIESGEYLVVRYQNVLVVRNRKSPWVILEKDKSCIILRGFKKKVSVFPGLQLAQINIREVEVQFAVPTITNHLEVDLLGSCILDD